MIAPLAVNSVMIFPYAFLRIAGLAIKKKMRRSNYERGRFGYNVDTIELGK